MLLLTAGVAAVLTLFLPLIALSFSLFRRQRRVYELKRIFQLLNLQEDYQRVYEVQHPGLYLAVAVAFCSAISWAGLSVLLITVQNGWTSLPTVLGDLSWVGRDQALVFGVAFLGAFLWGVQYLIRRYTLNDLTPAVYYTLGMRMILASTLAVLLSAAFGTLDPQDVVGSDTAEVGAIWPAVAFLIGTFPQRGVHWLTARLPMLAPEADPTVHPMPLEKVQGIELLDRMRLEEVGIDSCYDLASTDFVPLLLKTPFGARELIDWILQAKLAVHFGDAVGDLRERGIRTIVDLKTIKTEEDVARLAAETPATQTAIANAVRSANHDREIVRLLELGKRLGRYWNESDEAGPASPGPGPGSDSAGTGP